MDVGRKILYLTSSITQKNRFQMKSKVYLKYVKPMNDDKWIVSFYKHRSFKWQSIDNDKSNYGRIRIKIKKINNVYKVNVCRGNMTETHFLRQNLNWFRWQQLTVLHIWSHWITHMKPNLSSCAKNNNRFTFIFHIQFFFLIKRQNIHIVFGEVKCQIK